MSRPNTLSYQTLNWPEYNKALKRRGALTIWFDPDMTWAAKPAGKRGRLVLGGIALWQTSWPLLYHLQRGPLECLSVFTLGWMLQCGRGRSERVLTAWLAALVLGLQIQIGNRPVCPPGSSSTGQQRTKL